MPPPTVNERYGDLTPIDEIAHQLGASDNFRLADNTPRIIAIRNMLHRL